MNLSYLQKRVDASLEEARNQIQALADEFRRQRLLPFCREHKLTYLAGMGRTVFYRRGKPIDSSELYALTPIEEILNIEAVGRNDYFGFYIADITNKDLKGAP